MTVKDVGPLTRTDDSTVGSGAADVRNWKVASHTVRFTTPVLPVVPCATS